jgi:hypothetical protein
MRERRICERLSRGLVNVLTAMTILAEWQA